jgi:tetratricopeptide (TPR) repeat protein
MSFFRKLFGKQSEPEKEQPAVGPGVLAKLPPIKDPPVKTAPTDPSKDPNMIRVFDAYGRELFISKQEWRKNVLPGSIQSNWNKPDELYGVILGSLNDGFRSDVVAAAKQLFKIDHDQVRGACVWGIVLMEEDRLDEAEKIFRNFISEHGEDGSILTNLAKVYARLNNNTKAEEILWHALEVDPNQDNGLGWFWIIHKERGGDAAGEEALRRVADVPKSWRAQLWLARNAIARRDLPAALNLYQQSLAAAPAPIPHDLLGQMSGDLGNAAHLPELINLTLPRFDVAHHGLQVGNNLIKAMLDLGQIEPARRILQQLYAQNRSDWKQTLAFWDTELAKLNVETAHVEPVEKLSVAMLTIEGPVWLPEQSPAHELFPATSADAARLCFLGSTAETGHKSDKVTQQLSDTPGRLSRALPLFLAEQVEFNADAHVRTLIPWIQNPPGGFVLGPAWEDSSAAQYARAAEPPCDYVIVTHLKTAAEPWIAELRLIRTIDAKCLGTTKAAFPSTQAGEAVQGIARELLTVLPRHADVALTSPARNYFLPASGDLPYYLLRLEQLLAVRCSGMEGVSSGFLNGERQLIDGNIHLCLNNAKNPVARILLLQTMKAMKRVRPEIVGEYRDKLQMLQRQHPLDEPAQGVCQRLLNEVLAA